MLNYLLVIATFSLVKSELPFACPDDIYCHGELLHTVQMSKIYNDSKTFVDMKIKYNRSLTHEKFKEFMSTTGGHPNKSQVLNFVQTYFDPPGSEFEDWTPADWVDSPTFLSKIKDGETRSWCKHLNELWKMLGRKMKKEVKLNEDDYSIIYVPNPLIIPGGRFREFYYWDSYWIIKGLLLSEMHSTVRGMLSNFISMVDKYGFVPNGGRVYYTMRSQPPLLIPMFKEYLDVTQDHDFLSENIASLEKEFQFWMNNRTVTVNKGSKSYTLARYAETSKGPRPESYWEDVTNGQHFPTEELKTKFYSQVKSAAESGWDFSSRWFLSNGKTSKLLKNIRTDDIVPVDLNSILFMNMEILSEFYESLDMPEKSLFYYKLAKKWKIAINRILWDEEVGSWLDYDIKYEKRRNDFYASNLTPLWAKCYDESRTDIVKKIMKYLEKNQINNYPGGIPSSLHDTKQQWDLPNAWPPSQHIIIEGLEKTDDPCAMNLAYSIAKKWIGSDFIAYKETKAMFEKYDATKFGGHGGGGEYEVQLGFGWSNGVIMDLVNKYPDILTDDNEKVQYCSFSSARVTSAHLLLLGLPLNPFRQFIR